MEHHPTWLGDVVNRLLGWLAEPLLGVLGLHPHDPARPIPDHIATQLFIVLLCVVFFSWFRRRLSAENPGALQLVFEQLLSNNFRVGFHDILDDVVGHNGRRYLGIIGTVGLYILLCNSISLIPTFTSPTAHKTVPLGCALVIFLYYNVEGVRLHGPIAYAKHFMGPVLVMAPLMLIIEIVSHLARVLSLTVRLWVNMVVSELIYVTFLGLSVALMAWLLDINQLLGAAGAIVPFVIPPIFVGLHIFVAVLQAFIFTLLPSVYLAGAVAEEH